jgi:uncharacterized protein YndB with AHSA1/START domain
MVASMAVGPGDGDTCAGRRHAAGISEDTPLALVEGTPLVLGGIVAGHCPASLAEDRAMSLAPTVARDLYLPREVVFDAWTQAEHLSQWYAPPDCRVGQVVVEAVPGGRFEINWTDPSGAVVREWGRFEELTPPRGFVCALADRLGTAPERAVALHLTLEDRVDACRIVLAQHGRPERLPGLATPHLPDSYREAFRQQWERRLDRLEGYFSAI